MITKRDVKLKQFLLKINPKFFWKGKTQIDEFAFQCNETIKEIKIPDTITKIGVAAFSCSILEKVELSKNLEEIPRSAFEDTYLQEISIPASVKKIKKGAFFLCNYLKNVELNEGLESIESEAFLGTKITSIKFPSTIKNIDMDAFSRCRKLTSIEFPNKQIDIHKKAFSYENDISHIKFGDTEINLSKNEMFAYIKTLPNDDKFFILIYNKETEMFCGVTANGRQEYTIDEVNYFDNHDITMDIVYFWNSVKQKSSSKTVQKAKCPPSYILSAIGKNEELINAYFQTRSNGISQLETRDWFKNYLLSGKQEIIKLFILLGGCEDNASHQEKVLALFDKMFYSSVWYINDYFNCDSNLPQGLDCIRDKIIEYAHDKDNKIIIEHGFAKIKSEKTVQYHKQLLKLFEENYNNKVFMQKSTEIISNFPKIYKAYRQRLASLNPARNPNGNEKDYNDLKQRGIDFQFICEYFSNEKYVYKNKELKDVVFALSASKQDQKVIDAYDAYLTEAKQITKKAISKKKRVKVFIDNVVDKSDNKLKFFWPPITSVMALTIGNTFDTCYRVNGANEAGLINVLTNPEVGMVLIMNEKNKPIAYCRINYDAKTKGILIDNIELDKSIAFDESDKKEIWNACVRAIKEMKAEMNKEGKYPVERIHCKADSYNKVLKTIYYDYPTIYDVNVKGIEEKVYETNRNIIYKRYRGGQSSLSQIVIDGPEYELWTAIQNETER